MTKMWRAWGMISADTFTCKPIGEMVSRYLSESTISVDPFARNSSLATWTNDLNPDTSAMYHLDAREFLDMLVQKEVDADLIILDPPYSQAQVARSYQSIGREYSPFGEDNNAVLYKETRNVADKLCNLGSIVLSFGWNSVGMGKKRGYKIIEIGLVCHGGAHNDTICVAEKKVARQMEMEI